MKPLDALVLILAVAKLTGFLELSWWWVTAPWWVVIAMVLLSRALTSLGLWVQSVGSPKE